MSVTVSAGSRRLAIVEQQELFRPPAKDIQIFGLNSYVGNPIPAGTPITRFVVKDENAFNHKVFCKVMGSKKWKDAAEILLGELGDELEGILGDSFEGLRNFHGNYWHKKINRNNVLLHTTADPFPLSDGTGVELNLDFWIFAHTLYVRSSLGVDVNSRRTEEVPKSGALYNRVCFYALQLMSPKFADGIQWPVISLQRPYGHEMDFALLSKFPQLRDAVQRIHEQIGEEKMRTLDTLLRCAQSQDEGALHESFGGHEPSHETYAERLRQENKNRLYGQFKLELLEALGK